MKSQNINLENARISTGCDGISVKALNVRNLNKLAAQHGKKLRNFKEFRELVITRSYNEPNDGLCAAGIFSASQNLTLGNIKFDFAIVIKKLSE